MLIVCWIRLGFSRGGGNGCCKIEWRAGRLCTFMRSEPRHDLWEHWGVGVLVVSFFFLFAFDGGLRGEESGADTEE